MIYDVTEFAFLMFKRKIENSAAIYRGYTVVTIMQYNMAFSLCS